ncbi:unnamed protein product [Meganyctiphanes norvegica]|uniref:Uncharacterized protein n=1 Tax=Meganyctiphanes norvegica TaxID=48144 RepID=A0AAV2QUA6_MEGNR
MTKYTFYNSGRAIVPSSIPKYSYVAVDPSYREPFIPSNPECSLKAAIAMGTLTHKVYGVKDIQSKYQAYMDEKKDPFPLTSIHSSYRPHSYKIGSTKQETVESVTYRFPRKINVNLGHVINYSSRVPFDSYAKSSRCKDLALHERYKYENALAMDDELRSDKEWRFSPPLPDKEKFLTLKQITGSGSLMELPEPKKTSISQANPHLAIEL